MAKEKKNGNGKLEESVDTLRESMTNLNHAMSTFLARAAESDARLAELERTNAARMFEFERINNARMSEIDKRFIRIEALLMEHSRILHALPDAVCEKIGFRMPEQNK